jgi:hypothetical protein
LWLANQITALNATGFIVNHNASAPYANADGVVYHYVAWNDSAGSVKVGKNNGTLTDKDVLGIGFRPEFLFDTFIYNIDSPADQSPPGHFRTDAMPFNTSWDYVRTAGAEHLKDLLPDGFRVGATLTVNRTYTDCDADAGTGCSTSTWRSNVGPSPLAATQTSTPITVTEPNSFEMTFDTARGGNLANFYDLAEDPVRAFDLAGKPSAYFYGLFHSSMLIGGLTWANGTNSIGAKLDLLEATPTRVRVRQEAFYQRVLPATDRLAGVKGLGDYTIYPEKVAIRWNRRTTAALTPTENTLEIGVRRESDRARSHLQPGGVFGPGVRAFAGATVAACGDFRHPVRIGLARKPDPCHHGHRSWRTTRRQCARGPDERNRDHYKPRTSEQRDTAVPTGAPTTVPRSVLSRSATPRRAARLTPQRVGRPTSDLDPATGSRSPRRSRRPLLAVLQGLPVAVFVDAP